MPMPLSSKMQVAQKSPVRYSHVAHFVGLSLLRDPNLARAKVVKSASMPRFDCGDHGMDSTSRSASSASQPSLSVEKVDKLRSQIDWLKAERRAEKEQLKKVEHSYARAVVAEQGANQRAKSQRLRRDDNEEHIRVVDSKISMLKSQAKERSRRDSQEQARKARASSEDMLEVDGLDSEAQGRSATAPAAGERKRPATGEGLVLPIGDANDQMANTSSALAQNVLPDFSTLMFDSEQELQQYRRDAVRQEMLSKVERRVDPRGEWNDGKSVSFFEMKRVLIAQKLGAEELQNCWASLECIQAGNALEAFKLINLSGSGNICSQEFGDGVTRVGCQWQKLTGLKRPKDLFRLFDVDAQGTISLFELFPTERHKKKKDTGSTTPDFWKKWHKENPVNSFHLDAPKGRPPPWSTGVAEDGLALLYEKDAKNNDAAFMRKWMETTMRRMKARGKSDARAREICCFHIPKGTGPRDRQDVATFSEAEVKACKREYKDAVMEPQRRVLKGLFDLRETRKELANVKHKLHVVAMEPFLRQQALEEKNNIAKNMFGGMNLGMTHKPVEEEVVRPPTADSVDPEVADRLTEMTPF